MENPQPKLHESYQLCADEVKERRIVELDDTIDDAFDQFEVFELIKNINDPEYPLTLEQLGVVSFERCTVKPNKEVEIYYTPTIPHCSMAQIIGLMIKVKLLNNLPKWMKITVKITPTSHVKELDINKQINDKERVAAATENPNILNIIKRGFRNSDKFEFLF
jgi:metal-sulfur cluster biosynthetic enzyme